MENVFGGITTFASVWMSILMLTEDVWGLDMRLRQCTLDYRHHHIKSLTDEYKRLHWEAYAQKTERQEQMFKRILGIQFDRQRNELVERLEQTGKLEEDLLDSEISQRKLADAFKSALGLVYSTAYEDAV